MPEAQLVSTASLPWFPFLSDEVHIKLCRVIRATGEMALLIRVAPGGVLGPHYYHGTASAYTVSGQWRHRAKGWIAGPGDVMIAPAGSTHTLEAVGDKPMEAFVQLSGALEFRDEDGATLCIENAETMHGRYLAHCALHGIKPQEVVQ
ncbi:MAG TPA: 2,4'-dihydroxyacetophenone dioxygenase family protein [Usitatibacter sp.]|nr:2,4'-dihydroxyacetophenone dioxygenase family protein [Usitatibacter sp.]